MSPLIAFGIFLLVIFTIFISFIDIYLYPPCPKCGEKCKYNQEWRKSYCENCHWHN